MTDREMLFEVLETLASWSALPGPMQVTDEKINGLIHRVADVLRPPR